MSRSLGFPGLKAPAGREMPRRMPDIIVPVSMQFNSNVFLKGAAGWRARIPALAGATCDGVRNGTTASPSCWR